MCWNPPIQCLNCMVHLIYALLFSLFISPSSDLLFCSFIHFFLTISKTNSGNFTNSGTPWSNNCFHFWATYLKDDVHSCAHSRTLFTFWTAIFVKYDIQNEYLTRFWFAILVNEYKLYVSVQKSSKGAKFGQCLYLGVPLCYEQNWCAERSGHHL
jgi:hypothetical protein